MRLERATSPLDDGRDVVIYPAGASWGFRLPPQHTVTVDEGQGLVYLSTPDHGSAYRVERLEETEAELRVYTGAPTHDAHAIGVGRVPDLRAYSFPEIQHELERLKLELVSLRASAQQAEAWTQGASYDSHTAHLRARIRELRGGG